MKRYDRSTFAALLALAMLGMLGSPRVSAAHPDPLAPCDMPLRVELTPDVPNPRDPGFVSSLLGNHTDYRLTLLRQDAADPSVIVLDLTGPAPASACLEVVSSMRRDARVVSVAVQRDPLSAGQPMGTVQAGPDGDWVLKRASNVSSADQARVRYQCDIRAADQTGFDPTEDDGGVAPDEVAGKREDYLRAEAACFEAHGYVVR